MIHHLITAKSLSFDVEWPLTMIKVNFANDESELSDAKEDLKTLFTSSLREAYVLGIEVVEKAIEENIGLVGWKHTRGSHSDDFQDREPCNCMEAEQKVAQDTLSALKTKVEKLKLSAKKEEKV